MSSDTVNIISFLLKSPCLITMLFPLLLLTTFKSNSGIVTLSISERKVIETLECELLHLIEGGASCFYEAFSLSTGLSSGRPNPTTFKAGDTINHYSNSSPPYRGWRLLAII